MAEGEVADILIAPPALLDEQAKNGRISTQGRLMLGRVGAGVAVRAGAPDPDIATIEALKQAMLGANSIVYNPHPADFTWRNCSKESASPNKSRPRRRAIPPAKL